MDNGHRKTISRRRLLSEAIDIPKAAVLASALTAIPLIFKQGDQAPAEPPPAKAIIKVPDDFPEGVTPLMESTQLKEELYWAARRHFAPDRIYNLPTRDNISGIVNGVVNGMYERLKYPGRIPGLKIVPPKPWILLADDYDTYIAQTYYDELMPRGKSGAAFLAIFSMASMDLLSHPGALAYTIGHELGHAVIISNPQIMEKESQELLKDKEVQQEIKARELEGDDLQKFLKELVCDRIAVYATRDIGSVRGNFIFAQRVIDKHKEEILVNHRVRIPQIARRRIAQEEMNGRKLTPEQRAAVQEEYEEKLVQELYESALKKPASNDFPGDYYPSSQLRRSLAIKLYYELGKENGREIRKGLVY